MQVKDNEASELAILEQFEIIFRPVGTLREAEEEGEQGEEGEVVSMILSIPMTLSHSVWTISAHFR